jgi:hypothetical protein
MHTKGEPLSLYSQFPFSTSRNSSSTHTYQQGFDLTNFGIQIHYINHYYQLLPQATPTNKTLAQQA